MSLEQIQKDLDNLRAAVPELRGVLLASNEGRPIAHALPQESDPERLAALAAAASSLGRRMTSTLETGTLNEMAVSASEGQLFLYNAGNKAVLAVLGPTGANTGLIHLEARWAAREISERI